MLTGELIKRIVEASLMASDDPLSIDQIGRLFKPGDLEEENPREQIRKVLDDIKKESEGRGCNLVHVASGYRFQIPQDLSDWVSRLWEQKPPRYTRALLETLSLIAYQQPVTRGDIEEVRGVSVSTNIVRTLLERGWVREVGHREVPGRPVLYSTTKVFLDYFGLKSLGELPPLSEIRDLVEPHGDADSKEQQVIQDSEKTSNLTNFIEKKLSANETSKNPNDIAEESVENASESTQKARDSAQVVHLTLADE